MSNLIGQRATHLHGGAFASDRCAKQMRDQRTRQHQRHHAQGHGFLRIVNLVDQQVVARVYRLADQVVNQPHRKACKGKQPDGPAVAFAPLGRVIEGEQKQRGCRSRQKRHGTGKHQPFPDIGKQIELFGFSEF